MPIAHGSPSQPIRAIVTAATPIAARQLARDLAVDPALEISAATSAAELFDRITLARPSVILLDINLAGENTPQLVQGLTYQRNIAVVLRIDARERPGLVLDAVEQGALAVTIKPTSMGQTAELLPSLIWTLRAAAAASIPNLLAPAEFAKVTGTSSLSILALGAGMGGLAALTGVLTQLPADAPGTLVITGLCGSLTNAWTERTARRCGMCVKDAAEGDIIRAGQVLVAPGNSHLIVRRGSGGVALAIKDGPSVFHQKPSLDLLFNSLADTSAPGTAAVVFGGTGEDGVAGLLSLRKTGGRTVAESPQTSVCGDLPARAIRCGSAEIALPAHQIAQKLLDFAAASQLHRAA